MRYAKISHVALASESIYLLVKVRAQSPNIRVQLKANQPSNFLSRSCRITTLPKLAGSFPKHPQLPPSLVRVVRKRWEAERATSSVWNASFCTCARFHTFTTSGTSFSKAQVQENVFKWNDQKKDFS